MSQPSNPYGPSRGSGPGARPDSGFPYGAPPPSNDPRASGSWPYGAPHDPSQPIPDPYAVTPVAADQFRPPRNNRAPWIVAAIVGLVVLLGVGWTAIAIHNSRIDPASHPSPTPTVSLPTQTSNSVDFSTRGVKGNLTFVKTTWQTDALQILVRIKVTEGTVVASAQLFQAFDEQSNTLVASLDGAPSPQLDDATIEDGQQAEGWIVFVTSRQDITVLLFDVNGNVITALVVKG